MRQNRFMATQPPLSHRPWVVAALVCALGLGATAVLTWQLHQRNEALAHGRLVERADGFTQALRAQLDTYSAIAMTLRDRFVADPALGRRAFVEAAQALDVATQHPEIKNLAFTRYVRAADRDAFVARVRADTSLEPQGYPAFAIRPPGDRAEYFVADYLWPMQGNQGIHGLDISAQPANLASMRYAQTSGQPVASAPFDLLQESSQRTGFVIRIPVFRVGGTTGSPPAPTDFLGAVAVTLRVRDVIDKLRRDGQLAGLFLYLSDIGADYSPQSFPMSLPLFVEPGLTDPSHNAGYRRELVVFGRKWQVEMAPGQSFLTDAERATPWKAALVGGVGSILAAVGMGLRLRRRKAQASSSHPL